MFSALPFIAVLVFAFWTFLKFSDFVSEMLHESRKPSGITAAGPDPAPVPLEEGWDF